MSIFLVVLACAIGLALVVVGSAESIIWAINGPTDSPWWRELLRLEACVLLIGIVCAVGVMGPAVVAMAVLR